VGRHRASYERLKREDPQGWAEYVSDLETWDSITGDLVTLSHEWPEYNR